MTTTTTTTTTTPPTTTTTTTTTPPATTAAKKAKATTTTPPATTAAKKAKATTTTPPATTAAKKAPAPKTTTAPTPAPAVPVATAAGGSPATTVPPTTTTTTEPPSIPDDQLIELVGLDGADAWKQVRFTHTNAKKATTELHAYFRKSDTPEQFPWIIVRAMPPVRGGTCSGWYRQVALRDGLGCLREEPNLNLRFSLTGNIVQLQGRLTAKQVIAAANATTLKKSKPTVGTAGRPERVADQGRFVVVTGTDRVISSKATANKITILEYQHSDGSTIEVTSVTDSVDTIAMMRLDPLGGWKITSFKSIDGFQGRHSILDDRIIVFERDGAIVQVRSTGASAHSPIAALADTVDTK